MPYKTYTGFVTAAKATKRSAAITELIRDLNGFAYTLTTMLSDLDRASDNQQASQVIPASQLNKLRRELMDIHGALQRFAKRGQVSVLELSGNDLNKAEQSFRKLVRKWRAVMNLYRRGEVYKMKYILNDFRKNAIEIARFLKG